MTDSNALITRLEVIAKRYALDEVKEAAARIAVLEAELNAYKNPPNYGTFELMNEKIEEKRAARAALEKNND